MIKQKTFSLIIAVSLILLSLGCSQKITTPYQIPEIPSATVHSEKKLTPPLTQSKTPDLRPTSQLKINSTQIPPEILDYGVDESGALYKNVRVKLTFDGSIAQSIRYINLDNLQDNSIENSDIGFEDNHDDRHTLIPYPINQALAYSPGLTQIGDLETCETNIANYSSVPILAIVTNRPFCILTNEDRIAILQNDIFAEDLDSTDDDPEESITLIITVYDSKVIFSPSQTPIAFPATGGTPTPIFQIIDSSLPIEILSMENDQSNDSVKDATIKLMFDSRKYKPISYINVDDLSNNTSNNSDLVFGMTQENGVHYFLYPTNFAKVFMPYGEISNPEECKQYISEFKDEPVLGYLSGVPFCVMTNENRFAVVSYQVDSLNIDTTNSLVSFVVTISLLNEK